MVKDSLHEVASLYRSWQLNISTDSSLFLCEAFSSSWKTCFKGSFSFGDFCKVELLKQSGSSVSKGAYPSIILHLSVILPSSLLESSTIDYVSFSILSRNLSLFIILTCFPFLLLLLKSSLLLYWFICDCLLKASLLSAVVFPLS